MITTFYPPHHFGGDGVAVQHLSRALASRGHDVTVICDVDAWRTLSAGPEPPPVDEPPGITVIRLRSPLGPVGPTLNHQLGRPTLHARRIRRIVADGAFDVVHFHNVSLIGGPGLLGVGGDALLLYTAHEHWLVCPTHVLWRYDGVPCPERRCLRCQFAAGRPPQPWRAGGGLDRALSSIDVFFAGSAFSAQIHADFGFSRPMTVLPPGVPDRAPPDEGAPQERPYFLFAGRLEAIKGADDAAAAIASVEADLLVAGQGSQEIAGPNVRLLGHQDAAALHRLMHHAVAVVVPSRCYETFGIVVAEAARAGAPVIARRRGPLPDLVEQGGGLLFDDVAGLAAAMQRLLDDRDLRDRLGTSARAAFDAHWREDRVTERYLGILRDRGLSV